MRKLAIFTGSFSLGIFLSQYLLSAVWLLPCAVGAFLFSCGRLVVPGDWGRRLLLAGVGISLAFGWNWLYMRQVQRPMEAFGGHRACTDHDPVRLCCTHGLRRKGDCSCGGTSWKARLLWRSGTAGAAARAECAGTRAPWQRSPHSGMTISPPLPPRGSFCWLISAKPWRLGRRLRLLGGRSASDMPCKRRSGSFIGGHRRLSHRDFNRR